MLSCENLTAGYGEKRLFGSLGFSVGAGSLMVLKGDNGSGKTTLLKILAGGGGGYEGLITFEGSDIRTLGTHYAGQLHYLGHQLAVKSQLTVRQNIEFWAELRDTVDLVPAAIAYFKLQPLLDAPCYTLSAGWKKRVALARLMACYADIWLLDEPEANLDQEGKELLRNLIAIRADQGGTVILATHHISDFPQAAVLALGDFKGD